MSRPCVFDPKSFTVSQLAYRLKISISGAYSLLTDLVHLGCVFSVGRGRYALEPQGKTARISKATR